MGCAEERSEWGGGSGVWGKRNKEHDLFPIPHSPFPIPHSPFPIPHSPLPTPYSPLPTPHSPFPTPHSPLPTLTRSPVCVRARDSWNELAGPTRRSETPSPIRRV